MCPIKTQSWWGSPIKQHNTASTHPIVGDLVLPTCAGSASGRWPSLPTYGGGFCCVMQQHGCQFDS